MPCSYVSGGYYARNDGKQWITTMVLTANLFPACCFAIAFVLNTIAIFYQSLAAVCAALGWDGMGWDVL